MATRGVAASACSRGWPLAVRFRGLVPSRAPADQPTYPVRVQGETTKRKGWINHSIKGPESIADHMYRMALMALIAAIVGDITPSDGIPKAEKSRREQKALNEMCEVLGGGPIADEIKELWEEYENNSSIEANLVKDFDKVEMILQALEYEKGKFQTEIGKSWAAEVNARRKQRCEKQK
uniref:HD domain-containing protein n=1 Tax=Oryza brachyantha TaxID=4533 RepID=J3L293_ORYBR